MGLLNTVMGGYQIYSQEKDREERAEEREAQREAVERKKNSKLFEDVLKVEFNPTDKDMIIKNLTTLSSYVNLWSKDEDFEKFHAAALSKFDLGLTLLKTIDPDNPMISYFSKKTNRITSRKKIIIGCLIVLAFIFIFMFIMSLLEK